MLRHFGSYVQTLWSCSMGAVMRRTEGCASLLRRWGGKRARERRGEAAARSRGGQPRRGTRAAEGAHRPLVRPTAASLRSAAAQALRELRGVTSVNASRPAMTPAQVS